jgi:hypothetical protein
VVSLNVNYPSLQDGTGYPANVVLDVKAKNIKVNVQNAEHKKVGS